MLGGKIPRRLERTQGEKKRFEVCSRGLKIDIVIAAKAACGCFEGGERKGEARENLCLTTRFFFMREKKFNSPKNENPASTTTMNETEHLVE